MIIKSHQVNTYSTQRKQESTLQPHSLPGQNQLEVQNCCQNSGKPQPHSVREFQHVLYLQLIHTYKKVY